MIGWSCSVVIHLASVSRSERWSPSWTCMLDICLRELRSKLLHGHEQEQQYANCIRSYALPFAL